MDSQSHEQVGEPADRTAQPGVDRTVDRTADQTADQTADTTDPHPPTVLRRIVADSRDILRRAASAPLTLATTLLVFGIAGSLFVSSAVTARGTDLRSEQVGGLRELIERRASDIARAQRDVARTRAQVDALTSLTNTPALAAQQARADELQSVAGLTATQGPALRIMLDDAPRALGAALPEGALPDDLVVHQQDVQAVVNALWRGGASAMQIMDQRVLSTSAVRCVGNTLILQGRVYSPPFVITAIGDVEAMKNSLNTDLDVQTYLDFVDLYGLGWKVEQLALIDMPAWQGGISPRRARIDAD
jgi:uncharacterized protein YlxW (UPF0749 family)